MECNTTSNGAGSAIRIGLDKTEEGESKNNVVPAEDEIKNVSHIPAPDGGYGWVIVLASFSANVLVDGVIFTVGQSLLTLWEKDFDATTMQTSWIHSLLGGCYLLTGPLASALANQFGCRAVCIVGAIIAFFGFLLSSIVTALPLLYATFGLFGGIGFGLVYLPTIVIVNQYFAKRRAFALGIAVCGSGIGTTLFSQLNPFLLRLTGNDWRTFLVYIAFISLLNILCGLCFKSLQPSAEHMREVSKMATIYEEPQQQAADDHASVKDSVENLEIASVQSGKGRNKRFASSDNIIRNLSINKEFLSNIEIDRRKRNSADVVALRTMSEAVSRESLMEMTKPLSRKDIFYSGSVTSLHRRLTNPQIENPKFPMKGPTISIDMAVLIKESKSSWIHGVATALKSMLDLSLLKSITFIVFNIGSFLTACCLFVPFMYLADKATSIEATDDQKSYLLLSLGIVNIVARILCGIISDFQSVDPLLVSNLALIMGGISTMAVPLYTQYWMYIAYTIPFSFGVACFAALRSVICVELFGLERLSNAFGIVLLFSGMAALIGAPLAAVLKDLTGNFDLSFVSMGFLLTMSGVVCLPLRRLSRYEQKKAEKGGVNERVQYKM